MNLRVGLFIISTDYEEVVYIVSKYIRDFLLSFSIIL